MINRSIYAPQTTSDIGGSMSCDDRDYTYQEWLDKARHDEWKEERPALLKEVEKWKNTAEIMRLEVIKLQHKLNRRAK